MNSVIRMISSISRKGNLLTLLGTTRRCTNRPPIYCRHQCRASGSSTTSELVDPNVKDQPKQLQKSPPRAPNPEECCGTGCSDCTFLKYAEDLVDYYKDGGAEALQKVNEIPDPSVRMFVKTEIKFYLALDQDMRSVMKEMRQKSLDTKVNSQD